MFPIHIGNYTISNGIMLERRQNPYNDVCLCLGEPKGHDPHELVVGHVKSVGLTHPNIHVVDFEEDRLKGVLFYEEVLHKLPNDAAKKELESEKEAMKRITIEQFQRLLQEEKDKLNTKEQEKIKKAEKLEKKRLQAEEEYQKKLVEEERIKRENDIKAEQDALQKKKVEEEAKRLVDEAEARKLVDEAEAKQLVEEVEAKRKVEEQLKQQKSQELTKTPSSPSMPNLGIVNIPPQEYTPLNAIPGDSTFSSQVLNFEGTVVAIGDYYYDDRTKSIEKRSNKRKRGESTKSRSSTGRVLEWKLGLTQKRMLFKRLLPSMPLQD
jgi:hypothetical protein